MLKTRERKTSSRFIHRNPRKAKTASAGFFPFWLLAVLVIHDPRLDGGNMQQFLKSRRINTGLLGLKYTSLLMYVDLGPIYHATQLQQTPNFFVGSYVCIYIYIYTYVYICMNVCMCARKYLATMRIIIGYVYIYIYTLLHSLPLCTYTYMYTVTTSIQYTYIMCSNPGVDKNIDVPL